METTNNSRFRVSTEKLTEVSEALINYGYAELDSCTSEEDKDDFKILIDTEKETFYVLDSECLKQSKEIVSDKFNQNIEEVDLEEINNWN